MPYTPTGWINGSAPGISAENLNKIEQGIVDAHDFADSPIATAPGVANFITQLITSTTWVTVLSQVLSIPAGWPSYSLLGLSKFRVTQSFGRVRMTATPGGTGTDFFISVGHDVQNLWLPGLTATGNVTVALQMSLDSGTDPDMRFNHAHLHVMAFREAI